MYFRSKYLKKSAVKRVKPVKERSSFIDCVIDVMKLLVVVREINKKAIDTFAIVLDEELFIVPLWE